MFLYIPAYCEAGFVQYDGENLSFPETWSGQLVNSIETCPDSGLWLWGQDVNVLAHSHGDYANTT